MGNNSNGIYRNQSIPKCGYIIDLKYAGKLTFGSNFWKDNTSHLLHDVSAMSRRDLLPPSQPGSLKSTGLDYDDEVSSHDEDERWSQVNEARSKCSGQKVSYPTRRWW